MAQIVNDAETPKAQTPEVAPAADVKTDSPVGEPVATNPRAGLDKDGIMDLLARTRKSIYNHTQFEKLYRYSTTIKEIRSLSTGAVTKHIGAHKAFWANLHSRVGTFDGLDTTNPLFNGNGTIQFAKNSNGYGYYSVPITDRRKPEPGEEEDDNSYVIASSIVHIADPFYGSSMEKEVCEEMLDDLQEYITLGIYPTVCVPRSYADQMVDAEKYEMVFHTVDVGIIIDVQMEVTGSPEDGTEEAHLYAVVLWSPMYTSQYSSNMYGCFSGTVGMIAVNSIGQAWSPINEVSNIMARGVPAFEYHPSTMVLQTIADNHELRDLIDSAISTGQIKFGFVDHLLAKMQAMNEELKNATAKIAAAPQTPTVPGPKQHMPVEVRPEPMAEAPVYESESEEVPVEDASELDAVGRRMRLYDSDSDDSSPEPIMNAFRVDDDD